MVISPAPYSQVGEIMTDLGRAQHMHDRDDLLAESAERQLRAKLDTAFDTFRRKVEEMPQCRIHFEKPFKELGSVRTNKFILLDCACMRVILSDCRRLSVFCTL